MLEASIILLAFSPFLWLVKALLASGIFSYPGQDDVQLEPESENTFQIKDCRPQTEYYKRTGAGGHFPMPRQEDKE